MADIFSVDDFASRSHRTIALDYSELQTKHLALMGPSLPSRSNREYGIDIRPYLNLGRDRTVGQAFSAMPPGIASTGAQTSVCVDALLSDYYDIGLSDVVEQMLDAVRCVFRESRRDPLIRNAWPLYAGDWISLSADGRLASRVEAELARLSKIDRVSRSMEIGQCDRKSYEYMAGILETCERASAAARACLVAFDLKATLSELIQCEFESERQTH